MHASMRVMRLRVPLLAGFVAVTSLIGSLQAESQVTAAPTFSISTANNISTLTISDATSGASIYYATAGRTATTNSIQYTGPLTVSLPITIQAVAIAPGDSVSSATNATYSAVLGTTAVATSSNPSIAGQPITFTATVTPTSGSSIPAGSLQFSVNGVALGSPLQLNGNGVGTYTTSILPEGYLSISATYNPSAGAPTTSAAAPPVIQAIYDSQRQSNNVYFNNASRPLGSGFNHPYGVAVDANANVFVADSGNNSVKEILAAGGYATVNTLNTGFQYPTGVAVDSNENVFVADPVNSAVYKLSTIDGYSSIGTVGYGFNWPYGVAVDTNNDLFVADTGNHAVKWLPASAGYGNTITIGSGFQYPWGVATDSQNNLFVTDTGYRTVNELFAGSNMANSYTTVNPLARSLFSSPYGVAVDANDDLFVTDAGYNAVREISLIDDWSSINTSGSGLNLPIGVAVDGAGNLYVADTDNNVVKQISETGGNFGSVTVGSASTYSISMYFFFDAATTLGSTAVLTGGAPGLDFADAGTGTCFSQTPYGAVTTCTVDVTFTPTQSGLRTGLVELLDGSGNVLAAGLIEGVGLAAD